jgi:hypothetical protein
MRRDWLHFPAKKRLSLAQTPTSTSASSDPRATCQHCSAFSLFLRPTSMPVRRTKSCVSCRVAKARCSLSAPCSRCTKRRLECHYEHNHTQLREGSRNERFRPIRPLVGVSFRTSDADSMAIAALKAPSTSVEISRPPKLRPWMMATTNAQALDLSFCQGDGVSHSLGSTSSPGQAMAALPVSHKSLDACYADPSSPSWFLNLDFLSPADTSYISRTMNEPMSLIASSAATLPDASRLERQLTQRTRSLQQGSLTAKMVFSRLVDYTRMMADGKDLPPFIHPPCCQGQGDECSPNSSHQCLAEPLAICANLTRMFHSRTIESHRFVWQQICTHVRQMELEVGHVG